MYIDDLMGKKFCIFSSIVCLFAILSMWMLPLMSKCYPHQCIPTQYFPLLCPHFHCLFVSLNNIRNHIPKNTVIIKWHHYIKCASFYFIKKNIERDKWQSYWSFRECLWACFSSTLPLIWPIVPDFSLSLIRTFGEAISECNTWWWFA